MLKPELLEVCLSKAAYWMEGIVLEREKQELVRID